MKQKPLEIMPAAARSAHKKADATTRVVLEELLGKDVFSQSIMERVKTFEDVCAEAGEDPKRFEVPVNATARHRGEIYGAKIMLICEVFREGVHLDISNTNQRKYYPWHEYVPGSGFSYCDYRYGITASTVGARLCVDTAEKAIYIGKQFLKEYEDYKTLF